MASIPPSTWLLPPNRPNASYPATTKSLLFPPRTSGCLKPLLASPSEPPPPETPDSVNPAFAKAEDYKKSKLSSSAPEAPASVRLAMARAREYKKNKGVMSKSGSAPTPIENTRDTDTGEEQNTANLRKAFVENKKSKKEGLNLSSIDFMGLEFSEKKNYRNRPPGLVPVVDPLLEGDLPEVEIIVGDASKFEMKTPPKLDSSDDNDSVDVYKPKVSTWGVFPRPKNISKTFGGGRVIKPGELLETSEDKEAKEKRTQELIAAYKKKMGLTIDAKTKSECEKALKEGDNLMDLGKLREALPYYEKVMKDMFFQSELHGLAALQWSICQDSLRRSSEARVMYEKLQSHPNVQVSKKAKQFVYSFQAMDMMKVTSSSVSRTTGYEKYFKAFVENKSNYTPTQEEQNEDVLRQVLPFIIFLASPIIIVLLIAVKKSFQF